MTPIERDLDKALTGRSQPDQETAPLVDVARRLEGMLDAEPPDARRERALFATAVATRRRPTLWRYLAPAVAVTSLLVAVYFAGRAATPDTALYPVRKALQQVDLAPEVSDDVQDRLRQIHASLQEAGLLVDDAPRKTARLATEALKALGGVQDQIGELPADERDAYQSQVDNLERQAVALLALSIDEEEPESVDAIEERLDEAEDRLEDRLEEAEDDLDRSGSDDNSGSGGSDSGSGADNSGSGSDDSDSGGDSGSGSDGSGSDNSGSGSDDNSG